MKLRRNNRDFQNLVRSVRQAGRIRRGRMRPARVITFHQADIKSIRLKLGKSQSEFALMIGVSLATLQNWEQGRRVPEGPLRTFEAEGIKPLDALHLASAVVARADYFCTCDDRFLKQAKAADTGQTKVVSPLELITEVPK